MALCGELGGTLGDDEQAGQVFTEARQGRHEGRALVQGRDRARLAACAALMGERAGGIELPESYALRLALSRGLDALEAEPGGKAKR